MKVIVLLFFFFVLCRCCTHVGCRHHRHCPLSSPLFRRSSLFSFFVAKSAVFLFVAFSVVCGVIEGASSDCTILHEKTAICDDVCRLPSSTTFEAIHFTGKMLNLDCLKARPSIEEVVAKKKMKCIGMSAVLSTIRFPKEKCMALDDGRFVEVTIG